MLINTSQSYLQEQMKFLHQTILIDSEEESSDIEPSLEKVQKSIEKVSALLEQVCPKLKCQQCEFEAKNQNGLNMHVKSKHTNKS